MSHIPTHLAVRELSPDYLDVNSFAMLSTAPDARHAAVFVHGFGGDSYKTWTRLPELIQGNDAWKTTDIYFIGYRSVYDEIHLSATYIANFVRNIFPRPPSQMFDVVLPGGMSYSLRMKETYYSSIDLIGHSLGGVVLRAAILEFVRKGLDLMGPEETSVLAEKYSLLCKGRLLLFAPAQGGARIAGVKGLIANAFGLKAAVDIFRGSSPSFQELSAGSLTLIAVRDDTNHFAERYPSFKALRAKIAWAEHDDIVTAVPYRYDTCHTILRTGHTTVCKPSNKWTLPLTFATLGSLEDVDGAL